MNYCSNCGKPIGRACPEHDHVERYVCASCGITHYQNPRTIVACVAHWEGKILLCCRAQEPAVGQWVLPSGFLECGETLQEGAARETLEETGVVVDPEKLELYSVVNMTAIDQIIVAFRIGLTSAPVLHAGPECLEAAFKSEADMPADAFAWGRSMGDSARRIFEEVRTGVFNIHVVSMGSHQGEGYKSREYRIIEDVSRIGAYRKDP